MSRGASFRRSGIVLLVLSCVVPVYGETDTPAQEPAPVTVLDGKSSICDELVKDIPEPGRLCDPDDVRRVDIGGCSLLVEQHAAASPEAPALVLIHGGPGATHHLFHPHFDRATAFATVVYYDQRGCGQSDFAPGNGYSVQQASDDLDALRAALGHETWFVLGHSYGGSVAQLYATRHAERVRGLILVGSQLYGLGIEPEGSRKGDYISAAERERILAIWQDPELTPVQALFNAHRNGDWKRQNFYQPSDVDLAHMAYYEWLQDGALRSAVSNSLAQLDLKNYFLQCPLPTLLLDGRWDLSWTADKSGLMHEVMPNATLIVLPRAGHSPFEDQPEAFFGLLAQFMSTAPRPNAGAIAAWQADLERLRIEAARPLKKASGTAEKTRQRGADRRRNPRRPR